MKTVPMFVSCLALLAGCPHTVPCTEGLVEADGGCVSPDAPVAPVDACEALDFYADRDGDDHGDPDTSMRACTMPDGYVASSDDCDDSSGMVGPTVTEVCDGRDQNCDMVADETFDCAAGATTACTTTCGSMGTRVCTADCMLPADCALPTESCNAADDDCDGRTDEGALVVGPEIAVGMAHAGADGVVAVPTSAGWVVVHQNAAADLVARPLGVDGTAGSPITISSATSISFDVTRTGGDLLVAFLEDFSEPERISFVRLTEDLSMPRPSTIPLSGRLAPVHVASSDTTAFVTWYSATGMYVGRASYTSLSAFAASDFIGLQAFDVLYDSALNAAFVLFGDVPAPLGIYRLEPTGTPTRIQNSLVSYSALPVAAFDLWRDGGFNRLLTVQGGMRVAASMGGIQARLGELAADGSYTQLFMLPIVTGLSTGTDAVLDVDVTHARGRFFVAAIVTDAAGTRSWRVIEVFERTDMTFDTVEHVIEATTDADFVAVAAGDDGTVLTVAATPGGTVRAHRIGCL